MSQKISDKQLLEAAGRAGDGAHAPYSGFCVGAALQDERQNLHIGCNVENASYPEGLCAEANAIGAMVAAGGRHIVKIAIVGRSGDNKGPFAGIAVCSPCGGCRQRIREFADSETRILLEDTDGNIASYSMDELLPASFHAPGR